jgi:hypothetical protein
MKYLKFAELEPKILLGLGELFELEGEKESGLVEPPVLLIILIVVLL